ncbi:hypothetical protein LRAMOSA05042 [Lichtheimia ramosa]|uniref:GP-PDE domain-containing protein n=1 Tax=Lichtheimia ramosa TaxID=688394 RepID=A0A077X0W1_9FUNG|nr:hypothetical protein LRAMOSA05042 [Lichtheimia ramosa]
MTKDKAVVTIPDVVAHRGYSGQYPENTMISYEKAIENDATALEGDIRLTKDGEIVMMHDMTLNRTTTGTGTIGQVNWHGYIDSLVTKTDPPQPIPRFKEVVQLMLRQDVIDKNMYMIVDIKFDNPIAILNAMHDLLKAEFADHMSTLARQLVIGIWHVDFLKTTQALFPDFKICFIGLSLDAARKYFFDAADLLSMPFAALADKEGHDFIQEAHARGKRVATWTVNDVEQMHECLAMGVDAVVGDHVEIMVKQLREKVSSLSVDEYADYITKSTYLSHRRTRVYFYFLKKAMHYASRGYIGM